MVLVLFFALILALILIFFISTLKINIEKLEISNEVENTPIVKELDISLEIYIFNKFKILKKHITKNNMQELKSSKKLEKLKNKLLSKNKLEEKRKNVKVDLDIVKYLNPKLQNIDLELKLGTEDVVLTSFLIVIISIAISMLLSKAIDKYDENKYKYKIIPNYNNKNSIKIFLNGIIDIKLVNIINILFRLWFRSDEFDKRTSNRRTYDNSNEQYPRNDRRKYNYRGTYWNK